jgi:hypothetical protein
MVRPRQTVDHSGVSVSACGATIPLWPPWRPGENVRLWLQRTIGLGVLSNNAIVSEIFLQLSFLLSENERNAGTVDGASQLLHYLKHSHSL